MQSSDITPSPISFPPKVGFRKDINGLRAWAVMAVVLFHVGITQLQGVFIGVDIFFVLSGYLMTGIIISGLEKQSFSYGRFVLARAGRIFPPLIALVLILLILGWFFLANESYEALGNTGVGDGRWRSGIFCQPLHIRSSAIVPESHVHWPVVSMGSSTRLTLCIF